MSGCSYVDVDEEISFKVVGQQPLAPQNENDCNSVNTSSAAASDDNDICVAIKPFTLQQHDKRSGCAVSTPQTAKRVRRSSDAQEVLQDVTFRLDDFEPPTVVKPRREDKRMSVGFGLSLRNSCQDDFYAPKYSEAELETMVEERCAELQREHDRQLCAVRNDLLNAESRVETLEQEVQAKAGENQQILLDLATQLEDLEKKAEETAGENVLLKAQVTALAKQVAHYETQGHSEAAELKAQLEAEAMQHTQELQQQREKHVSQLAELTRQHDDQLQRLRGDHARAILELQGQVELLKKEMTDKVTQLQQQAEAKELAIQKLQEAHAAEVEQTKLKVKESFRKKFEKGNQEYHALQQQHEASLQKLASLQQRVASLEEADQQAQAITSQLREAAQRAEAQLAQERDRAAEFSQEVLGLKRDLASTQSELERAQSQLEETAKERDAQMFAVARLVTGKEANEAELQKLRAEADSLRAQNTQLTSMNEQLLEMLEKYYAEQDATGSAGPAQADAGAEGPGVSEH